MELAVGDCQEVEDDGEGGNGRHAHHNLGVARGRAGHQLADAREVEGLRVEVVGCGVCVVRDWTSQKGWGGQCVDRWGGIDSKRCRGCPAAFFIASGSLKACCGGLVQGVFGQLETEWCSQRGCRGGETVGRSAAKPKGEFLSFLWPRCPPSIFDPSTMLTLVLAWSR